MPGFADIGDFFAGNHAGNELAYQKGMALGASTENAMAEARKRVRENTIADKMQNDPSIAAQLGLGDAGSAILTMMAGGFNPQEALSAGKTRQEIGFRDIAGSPDASIDAGARNRALTGLASGPVETFKAVGSKGYQDVFHPEQGVIPLGSEFNVGAGGGDAAAIQILRAFGMLDAQGHVVPGHEKQAFDVMRTTGKTVDEGGVPGVIDFNPFAAAAPRGVPVPATPGAVAPNGIGADIVPPFVPTAVPVQAPAAAPGPVPATPGAGAPAAAAPPMAGVVAGPGVVTPASSAARVASNTAEIEKAKIVGKGAGEAVVAQPDAVADIEKLRGSINHLLGMPGLGSVYGHIQGRPLMQTAMGYLSQDAADAQAALKNIDAQTFGIAIQKMRGLGQLSNAEGLKVTDAFSRATNPTISEPEATAAWQEVLTYLDAAEARAARKTNMAPGNVGAAPAAGAYSDPAKEARYQAWKASQGIQ